AMGTDPGTPEPAPRRRPAPAAGAAAGAVARPFPPRYRGIRRRGRGRPGVATRFARAGRPLHGPGCAGASGPGPGDPVPGRGRNAGARASGWLPDPTVEGGVPALGSSLCFPGQARLTMVEGAQNILADHPFGYPEPAGDLLLREPFQPIPEQGLAHMMG